MTGAWQYPVNSHPWFRMPSHKRKAFEREDSSSSDYSDLERYAHPSKRLRCGILENGLAQLSLDAVNQFPVVTEPPSSYTLPDVAFADDFSAAQQNTPNAASFTSGSIAWDGTTYDATQADLQHSQPVVLPGSVEEPTSPEAPTTPEPPDITMKSRSWYEPEKDRIVVVDLDDSDVEDLPEDEPQLTVNSALLNRIKGEREPLFVQPKDSGSSMALVLFKPLPIPDAGKDTPESDSDAEEGREFKGAPVDLDVDCVDSVDTEGSPMDVDDPMDIE